METLHAQSALLQSGWHSDVRIVVDDDGSIRSIEPDRQRRHTDEACGVVLPGVPNGHSHAFQRVLAGRTEYASASEDDFWTWRNEMYAAAERIRPDNLLPIVEMVYAEMLEAGYTSVAEFHYLHHRSGGKYYDPVSRLADVHVEAAANTGIRLTLLPTLYAAGGFGAASLADRQRRFGNSAESFIELVESIRRQHPTCRVGIGLHSLRAVTPDDIDTVVAYAQSELPGAPVHIHIAEQEREVEDALAHTGRRPISWLLDHCPVGANWNLVHATHADADELAGVAAAGATVVLCPTTEANLGDGIFPWSEFQRHGGRFAIGSDSQATVDPLQELQLLEYGQRLAQQRRNVAATAERPHSGANLYKACLAGGRSAVGRDCGWLAEDGCADLVVVNDRDPRLAGSAEDGLLDAMIFVGARRPIDRVMVNGKWLVERGRHVDHRQIGAAYQTRVASILQQG